MSPAIRQTKECTCTLEFFPEKIARLKLMDFRHQTELGEIPQDGSAERFQAVSMPTGNVA
jgi:hypothetical protein